MQQQDGTRKQTRFPARFSAAAATLLCLGLLVTTSARASYEQVGTFAGKPGVLKATGEPWPEEVQLGSVGGMAVNYTGTGGVPKGTLYAATSSSPALIARYSPTGSFSERWTFNGPLGGAPQERCGPEGDPSHPTCSSLSGGGAANVGVSVDQSTGNVYVIDGASGSSSGVNRVHVYTPDGSKLIAEFGEQAPGGDTFADSPGKIHGANFPSGIGVDTDGRVYVYDRAGVLENRLMEFEPQSPGDYEHYVYAGRSQDFNFKDLVYGPIFDAADNLYAHSDSAILALDPSAPGASPSCEFKFPVGGVVGMTVDPLSGEVFFRSQGDKKIHVLSPCDGEGHFTETGKFAISPPRAELKALTFDPGRQVALNRPPGVLYAGAPSGEGGKTEAGPPPASESSLGYVFAHPVEQAPEVLSESAVHITATTAEVNAQINPEGPPTRYVFQYLTQAEYEANDPSNRFVGAMETPAGGAFLGEGSDALGAGASLSGLVPDTIYHYRALATSHCSEEDPAKTCEGVGQDQSFRTFPQETPQLPDDRAYELVSPTEKAGGSVFPADASIARGCAGLCKPGGVGGKFPRQSTPDGEAVAYEGSAFSGEGSAVGENEYVSRRDPKTGWQTTNPAPEQLTSREGTGYKAFDTALTRAVLEQGEKGYALAPEALAGFFNLYAQPVGDPLFLSPLLSEAPTNRAVGQFELVYAGASSDLSRVFFEANDVLGDESPFAPEAKDGGEDKFNLYEWAEGQIRLVNVMPGNIETEVGASFGAGSAHSVSSDGSRVFWEGPAGQVYLRENAEATVEVPDHVGRFVAASVDGSRVLLSDGALYDLQTEGTTDLTEGQGGFQGVVGESRDLSHVYFVDTAVLNEGENEYGDKAQPGKFNLYAWETGRAARFVASLSVKDNETGAGVPAPGQSADWRVPSLRTAEASPQGRYLAFLSVEALSGYGNGGPCGHGEIAPCPEAFLYDSVTNKLSCASCNPSGQPPLGPSVLRRIYGVSSAMAQPRYLTDQGRLYFDSQDSLSPFDTNEGFEDVYQYESSGVGTCERAAGCLNLISAGSEPRDSNLLAVDESGKNVFFTTRDQLVLKDKDDLVDLYDAREDGGIPGETEVSRGECQGEACVPAISPPNDPTPGSSTFEGAGNVDEKKAAKKHAKKHKKHTKKAHHKRAAKRNRGGAK